MRFLAATAGLLLALGPAACLDAGFLEGKACDEQDRCLEGFVCNPDTRRCVQAVAPDGGEPDAGDPGPGDPGPGDTEPVVPEPIVLYTFDTITNPPQVPDEAAPAPNVRLKADDRDPLGLTFTDGAVSLSGGRLEAVSGISKNLGNALIAAGSFTVTTWATAHDLDPEGTGPKRLVTLSSGAYTRAFTLGQQDEDLVARLRTSITDENGRDHEQHVRAFTSQGVRHYAFTFDGTTGAASVFVDGQLRDVFVHLDDQDRPATLTWDTDRERFGLGDEFDAERRWDGTLFRVTIWDAALGAEPIRALFEAGPAD